MRRHWFQAMPNPRIGVDDERDVDEAPPSRHVGEVAYPEPVRRRRLELPVHLVAPAWLGWVGDGRPDPLAADDALQAHGTHQPLDCAARDLEAFPQQLAPDLPGAVDAEVLRVDAGDLDP